MTELLTRLIQICRHPMSTPVIKRGVGECFALIGPVDLFITSFTIPKMHVHKQMSNALCVYQLKNGMENTCRIFYMLDSYLQDKK